MQSIGPNAGFGCDCGTLLLSTRPGLFGKYAAGLVGGGVVDVFFRLEDGLEA